MAEEGQGNLNAAQVPEVVQEEEEVGLELGVPIKINGGTFDGTKGIIYEISDERFSILATGTTDRLIHIDLEDGGPKEDYGIQGIDIGDLPGKPGFVAMVGLLPGASVEFLGPLDRNLNAASSLGIREVRAVDFDEDSAIFRNETGEEQKITFGFTGIPRETGIEIIRLTKAPGPEEEEGEKGGAGSPRAVGDEDIAEGEGPGQEEEEIVLGENIEVEEKEEVIRELGSADRMYADDLQRSDMLTQLIQTLLEKDKRNISKLQQVRREVETFLALRNRVIKYGKGGEPLKRFATSATTLTDLMNRPGVNMNRKIIKLRKTLTLDHSENDLLPRVGKKDNKQYLFAPGERGEESVDPVPGKLYVDEGRTDTLLDFTYLEDVVAQAEALMKEREKPVPEGYESAMPKFNMDMERYREEVQDIYRIDGGGTSDPFVLEKDEDIFRIQIPDLETRDIYSIQSKVGQILDYETARKELRRRAEGAEGPVAEGAAAEAAGPVEAAAAALQRQPITFKTIMDLIEGKKTEKEDKDPILFTPPPTLGTIGYSTARVITNRFGRFLQGTRDRIVEGGDPISYDSILIFPRSALRDLGPIRSGELVQDVSLGITRPKTIRQILSEIEIPPIGPTVDDIITLDLKGLLLGNLELTSWLKDLNLFYTGPGDVRTHLGGYGMNDIELNLDQANLIQEKILEYIGTLRKFIRDRRAENEAAINNMKYENQNLLPEEGVAAIKDILESEPMIRPDLEEFRIYMGDLAESDIYFFSYLYLKYPDLFIAVLGQQAIILAREKLRKQTDKFLLANFNGDLVFRNKQSSGELPRTNSCEHVKALEQVRKLEERKKDEPEDVTRMRLLIKVVKTYRGKIKNDWMDCNKCGKHLICGHEVLLMEEFKRPEEKQMIHKNLLLKYSGGVFAGKYICKNCGQAIQDLDFDTNLEFDDEGRPMMGRAVLVDEEAIREELVDALLSGPAAKQEEIQFGSAAEKTAYSVFRTLCGLIGIAPTEADYREIIKDHLLYEQKTLTQAQFMAQIAKMPPEQKKTAPTFAEYKSKRYLASCISILLIKIQTRIPEFEIKYVPTECRLGFGGFPLHEEGSTNGLDCILTMAVSVEKKMFPWNETGILAKRTIEERVASYKPYVLDKVLKIILSNSNLSETYKVRLEKKRKWREESGVGMTESNIAKEQIASSFRPYPYVIKPEEAAADAVIPEAATPELQATAWIRTAHALARRNAILNPERAESLTTCCYHEIDNPRGFWQTTDESALPLLEKRTLGNRLFRTATSEATFYTEKQEILKAKIPESEYYKLFSKFCHTGEQVGEPHELGLGLICANCGLQFDQNPNVSQFIPTPGASAKKEEEEKKAIADTLKANIEGQGIDINEETFYALLAQVQQKSKVAEDKKKLLPNPSNIFTRLAQQKSPLSPEDNWVGLLMDVQQNMMEISAAGAIPTKEQISTATEDLRNVIIAKQKKIKEVCERENTKEKLYDVLLEISQRNPREISEILRTSFLVPFQRILTGMTADSFKVLSTYGLGEETEKDILTKGLVNHLRPISKIGGADPIEIGEFLRRVIEEFIDDLSSVCTNILSNLRAITTLGGKQMVLYFIRAYMMGPIFKLISDPNPFLKEGIAHDESYFIKQMSYVRKMLYEAIKKYKTTSKIPTNDEIRLELEKRVEAEKQVFIKKLDAMTTERRQVELMLKKNGMGDWAVGGSKSIREYDEDRYEAWRRERAAAGLVDWVDPSTAEGVSAAGAINVVDLLDAQAGGAVDGGEYEGYAGRDEDE